MLYISHHAISDEIIFERESITAAVFSQQYQKIMQQQHIFAQLDIGERIHLLLALADKLQKNKSVLAQQICIEVGRCLRECEAEVDKSIGLIRYYAKVAPNYLADKTVDTEATLSQVRFEALGVILAVMPWNYPLWQVIRFAIPALCAGNACLVKPAPSVGKITQMLFDLVGDTLPFQVTWLANADIELAIATTDALAFTGSTQTGRHLASIAGKHLHKSVMELGGSNAFIVLADADLTTAAQAACYSRFRDAGQSCNAAKRLIVQKQIAEQFVEALKLECQKLRMGAPWLAQTTLPPMHRADLRERLQQQVDDALAQGARCLLGGYIPSEKGFFYPATLLDHVNPNSRIYNEEVFGPVAVIMYVDTDQEAIKLANDSPFGLGASIYTQNVEQAWSLGQQLEVGSVFINRHTSSDFRLPFGGIKDSGFGRELSEFGLYQFVNIKSYWQK